MKPLRNNLILISLLLFSGLAFSQGTSEKNPVVEIKTTEGTITVMLYNDTPKHRDNFIKLAKSGFYEGRIFHRVINNFMIQAGWTKDGVDDPEYKIESEIRKNHIHKRGALAAARQGDQVNPERKSSGCQFYIVQGRKYNEAQLKTFESRLNTKFTDKQIKTYTTVGGTPHLDGAYTVFGEVLTGMDVVDKIAAAKTARGNKPVEDITIISMNVIEE